MPVIDTCRPNVRLPLQSYRIYSILFPIVIGLFMLECIYVFVRIPSNIGDSNTILGPYEIPGELQKMISKRG